MESTHSILHSPFSVRASLYYSILAWSHMHMGACRAGCTWHKALPRYAHASKYVFGQVFFLPYLAHCLVLSRALNSLCLIPFFSTPWSTYQAFTDCPSCHPPCHFRINRVINRKNHKKAGHLDMSTISSGVLDGISLGGSLPISFSTLIFFSEHHTLAFAQESWVFFKYYILLLNIKYDIKYSLLLWKSHLYWEKASHHRSWEDLSTFKKQIPASRSLVPSFSISPKTDFSLRFSSCYNTPEGLVSNRHLWIKNNTIYVGLLQVLSAMSHNQVSANPPHFFNTENCTCHYTKWLLQSIKHEKLVISGSWDKTLH